MAGTRFWIGASTTGMLGSPAAGIRPLDVDADGTARLGAPVDVGPNPQFLASVPGIDELVVVHELSEGLVSAWRIEGDALSPDGHPVGAGADPCHVAVGGDPAAAYVANYSSGSLTVHPLTSTGPGIADPVVTYEGTGPVLARQEASHAHQIVVDAAAGELLVVDLGGDAVHVHALDTLEHRRTVLLHGGAGPRHLVLVPGTERRIAIVACELDRTVAVVDLDAGVELGAVFASAGDDPHGLGLSAIRMTSGGIVLVGDRSTDSLRAFRYDRAERTLEPVGAVPTGGRHPRDLELTADERFALVADQASDSIAIVALDEDGVPTHVASTVSTPAPACVLRLTD
ncbi:lactonase family protein [Agromyces seonyuensis]|uniref:Beta-propeller fold lactonase family protein n=1 Tax=Agromyces seonyuensis TaxID=2662446 RepID=A0A6I4NTR6_9MICO|nr:beta-propeller fold lactonase family protein [Agromyces seonyuensis]MWB97501.1 beta-propeller fold lactonase family protein [Agromyces seonyuensis]